jgi:outer membrane protein OmpA-like peptidoglycan-associated protein
MQKVRPRRAYKLASAGFILALAAISGCSTVDSGLRGVPGTGKPFPNLATVPEKPTNHSTPAERKAQEEKLVIDRAAATPLGSSPASGAAVPQAAAATAASLVPLTQIDQRDIDSGGWLNSKLPDKLDGALAGLVFFDNGSTELKPKARDVLRAVAALQHERGGVLRLIGNASSPTNAANATDAAEINKRISLRRAEAAAAELRRLGLEEDQIQVSSRGAEAPAYDEASPVGEAGNRRVEIYLEL